MGSVRLGERVKSGAKPPHLLIAIDSGDPQGLAYFLDGFLWGATSRAFGGNVGRSDVAVCELPDHLRRGKVKDVTLCAARGGATAGMCSENVVFMPVQSWKGSLPKEVTKARALEALTQEEIDRVSSNASHAWDAIGIGLYYLRRTER